MPSHSVTYRYILRYQSDVQQFRHTEIIAPQCVTVAFRGVRYGGLGGTAGQPWRERTERNLIRSPPTSRLLADNLACNGDGRRLHSGFTTTMVSVLIVTDVPMPRLRIRLAQ